MTGIARTTESGARYLDFYDSQRAKLADHPIGVVGMVPAGRHIVTNRVIYIRVRPLATHDRAAGPRRAVRGLRPKLDRNDTQQT
jgi:hypothetical protein